MSEYGDNGVAQSIGWAEIHENGTITLHLRASGLSFAGSGILQYDAQHPQYAMVAEHVGQIKIGERKSIRPFP